MDEAFQERMLALQEQLLQELPANWIKTDTAKKALEIARKEHQKKHGFYSSMPMICKGHKCPYAKTCYLLDAKAAPEGDRCPIEAAFIMERFERYSKELGINLERVVDMSLLRDLIECELMIDRCDRLLAQDGDLVVEVFAGSSPVTGEVFTKPEAHQALGIKDKMQKRKNEILQLLNSTRKDQAKMAMAALDPSTYATNIMAKVKKIQGKVIEGEITSIQPKESEQA